MNKIEALEKEQLRTDIPDFGPGDTLKVFVKVVEGTRERVQLFEGMCIARKRWRTSRNVYCTSYFIRCWCRENFPCTFSKTGKIEVVHRGIVRRAKLYYLRRLTGKAARIRERR